MRNPLEAFNAIPAESRARRLLLSLALGAGLTFAILRWFLVRDSAWTFVWRVPLPLLIFTAGALLGALAAGGGAWRRSLALWSVVGTLLAVHVGQETLHWLAPFEGTIAGYRVDLLQEAGSLLALASILLLHAEVEAYQFARDVTSRGAPAADASAAAAALVRAAQRRVGAVAGVVFALAGFVWVADKVIREGSLGLVPLAAAVGFAVLAAAGVFAWRATRAIAARGDAQAEGGGGDGATR